MVDPSTILKDLEYRFSGDDKIIIKMPNEDSVYMPQMFDKYFNYLGKSDDENNAEHWYEVNNFCHEPMKWMKAGKHNFLERVLRTIGHNFGKRLFVWDNYFIIKFYDDVNIDCEYLLYNINDNIYYKRYKFYDMTVCAIKDDDGWTTHISNKYLYSYDIRKNKHKDNDREAILNNFVKTKDRTGAIIFDIQKLDKKRSMREYDEFVRDMIDLITRSMSKLRYRGISKDKMLALCDVQINFVTDKC